MRFTLHSVVAMSLLSGMWKGNHASLIGLTIGGDFVSIHRGILRGVRCNDVHNVYAAFSLISSEIKYKYYPSTAEAYTAEEDRLHGSYNIIRTFDGRNRH